MKDINEIEQKLIKLQDKEYKIFSLKSCPDTNREILGIRIPQLRNLAKEIVKDYDWKKFIENAEDKYFEEVILQGFVIAYSKINIDEKLILIKKFVPKIDSWAVCDTFVPTLKIKNNDLEKIWKFILPYTKSDKEFEIRFSVIMMLDYYITDEYVDKVIEILDKIEYEGYYVKMGVAWTLAEIGIKYNNKAMKYLSNENNLDNFTYNKTLQKMIESYRIDKDQKIVLKNMKRKVKR